MHGLEPAARCPGEKLCLQTFSPSSHWWHQLLQCCHTEPSRSSPVACMQQEEQDSPAQGRLSCPSGMKERESSCQLGTGKSCFRYILSQIAHRVNVGQLVQVKQLSPLAFWSLCAGCGMCSCGIFFAHFCSSLLKLWRLHLQAQLFPLKSALCSCDIWGWREKLPPWPSGRRTSCTAECRNKQCQHSWPPSLSAFTRTSQALLCLSAGLPWAGAAGTGHRVRSEALVKSCLCSYIGLVLWNHTGGVRALLLEITKEFLEVQKKGKCDSSNLMVRAARSGLLYTHYLFSLELQWPERVGWLGRLQWKQELRHYFLVPGQIENPLCRSYLGFCVLLGQRGMCNQEVVV